MPRTTRAGRTTADLPDLRGTTTVVTGANSGIGLATTRALAARGSHVLLAVRNPAKGEAAAASVDGSTEVRPLDLADLASVRSFVDGVDGDIDLLINNAGIMATPQARTRDGFESQLGTNHLGPFALTNLLLPQITGRVVTVSSLAHRGASIDFDDPNWTTRRYRPWAAYSQSKLANLLFTLELQRRLTAEGSSVRALAAHPGVASTELGAHAGSRLAAAGTAVMMRLLGQSAEDGARPTLHAATADLPGGSFVGPSGLGGTRGAPAPTTPSAAARDADVARRLWLLSTELTSVAHPSDTHQH